MDDQTNPFDMDETHTETPSPFPQSEAEATETQATEAQWTMIERELNESRTGSVGAIPDSETSSPAESVFESDSNESSGEIRQEFNSLEEEKAKEQKIFAEKRAKQGNIVPSLNTSLHLKIGFTIMVAGETGLGKTTFVNTFLNKSISKNEDIYGKKANVESTAKITCYKPIKLDNGTMVNLIDTPGYGDKIDSSERLNDVVEFIKNRFNKYLQSQNEADKENFVHLCVYFIAPHRLKEVDVEFMKRLQPYVNIIPVLAKADTMTKNERFEFKQQIQAKLRADKFEDVLQLSPDTVTEDQLPPFAIIGGEKSKNNSREYPWGTANALNPNHSDLQTFRDAIYKDGQLFDLISSTNKKYMQMVREKREEEKRQFAIFSSKKFIAFAVFVLFAALFGVMLLSNVVSGSHENMVVEIPEEASPPEIECGTIYPEDTTLEEDDEDIEEDAERILRLLWWKVIRSSFL